MVFKITRFLCKPDMTSSWIRRQGALHANIHDGFWKSDRDFLIAFYTKFLSEMHGFRDNEVLLQAGYDVIVISTLGLLPANFHDKIWKSNHDFLIVFHSIFISAMHGFRDNEVLLLTGYDVMMISLLGALPANFLDGIWESDHDFLIVFHGHFLSRMHGFRDNEVLLPTGNDVIVISPLEDALHRFCWRNLKERPRFHNHGSLT